MHYSEYEFFVTRCKYCAKTTCWQNIRRAEKAGKNIQILLFYNCIKV